MQIWASNIDPSTYQSFEISKYRNFETSKLRNIETSKLRNIETSKLRNIENNKGFPLRKAFIIGCFIALALSQLAVRTEHIHNLVDIHLLHVLTSGLQILTRIEVSRMLSQVLADSSSHSQTRVRVGSLKPHAAVPRGYR